jgi:hypothetical protein
MDMILALLIQAAIAPDGAASTPAPRLAYADAATEQDAPRPRVNQGRSAGMPWAAIEQSIATEARREAPRPAAQRRQTQATTVPVRMINGQAHGVW